MSELRDKDMELAMLLNDKMRIMAEMSDMLEVENPTDLGNTSYLHLIQEKERGSVTKEELLEQITKAAKLANSLCRKRQVDLLQTATLNRSRSLSLPCLLEDQMNYEKQFLMKERLSKDSNSIASDHSLAMIMTHYMNKIMCMVNEYFTSMEKIKVELSEHKERSNLGYGRYKHNQQVEELRMLQEQLNNEKKKWQEYKEEQEREISIIVQSLESTKARLQVMKWSLEES